MNSKDCSHSGWKLLFEYSPDFHDRFSIFYCPECKDHFLLNSWEHVDWKNGRDTPYIELHPLTAEELEEHKRRAGQWGP